MVDQLQNAGTNPLANALTNAAAQAAQAQPLPGSDRSEKAAQAYNRQLEGDGSTRTTISPKAQLLSQALQFARQVPSTSVDDMTDTRVADLKALYQAGGAEALLNRYDNNELADSLFNSPVGAFLRK